MASLWQLLMLYPGSAYLRPTTLRCPAAAALSKFSRLIRDF